jgi:UDP-N-acetylglucosamine acyltransferase
MTIHRTATISDGAQVHETAEIGPYVVIGPNVRIGEGTSIGAHAVIDGVTTIGANCRIYAGTTIGLEPQDLRYKDESTGVIVGDRVTLREYVTIHRATGEGNTVIGDDCFFMVYCHVAHNCKVGSGVIMANSTGLAGHVQVSDRAVISALCAIHQFVRVGRCCMVGGMTGTRVDLPPFTLCDGRPANLRGLNVVGLRRNKIAAPVRQAIKQAYKLIYYSGLNTSQALSRIEQELEPLAEVKEIVEFYRSSKRGVVVPPRQAGGEDMMEEAPFEVI